MQSFSVTILPLNGEQFSGQQRMRQGKKELLKSYGTYTNTSNIPRPMKGFVKILQVKKCMREFWDCLIFCVHKGKMDDAIPFTMTWGGLENSSYQGGGETGTEKEKCLNMENFIPCRLNGGCKECLKGAEAQMQKHNSYMYTDSKTKTVSLRGGSKISLFSKGWAELDKLVPFYQHHSHEERFSRGCHCNSDIVCSYR